MRTKCWYGVVTILLMFGSGSIYANENEEMVYRSPRLIEPGLNDKWFATGLNQEHFASGTYRIKESGYYFLEENIVFNPDPMQEAGRSDKPFLGWPAAISIEANNVIFDLNQKSIEADPAFVNKDTAKIYSTIILGNTACLGQNSVPLVIFKGEVEQIFAHNVVIRNGSLGRSSGHGICGVKNSSIQCYDLVIGDGEGAGIFVSEIKSGSFKNICISGAKHPICNDCQWIQAHEALGALALLKFTGVMGDIDMHIDALNTFTTERFDQLYNEDGTLKNPDECPGIYAVVGGIVAYPDSVTGLVTTTTALSPEMFARVEQPNCVCIENVQVCDICYAPQEVVCLRDKVTKKQFQSLSWDQAYNQMGMFEPSDIFKAQTFVLVQLGAELPAGFAANILGGAPDEGEFLSQVEPCFSRNCQGFPLLGLVGIGIGGNCSSVADCHVACLHNKGAKGVVQDSLPGAPFDQEQTRYTGADISGIACIAGNSCSIANSVVSGLLSDNGHAFGITVQGTLFDTDVVFESSSNKIEQCCIRGITGLSVGDGPWVDEKPGRVNLSSRAAGVYIGTLAHDTVVTDCQAFCITAPRAACGFHVNQGRSTLFTGCKAVSITATTGAALNEPFPGDFKRAVGFKSLESTCTEFRHCFASGIRLENEQGLTPVTTSKAAGFLLLGRRFLVEDIRDMREYEILYDQNGVVDHCTARCASAGSSEEGNGTAAGVLLGYTHCATVINSEVSFNGKASQQGFGICDLAGVCKEVDPMNPMSCMTLELPDTKGSDSIILRNRAYINETANYKVVYENPEAALPLSTGTNTSIKPLAFLNDWNNILFEKHPGKEQKTPKKDSCSMTQATIIPC